MILFKFLQKCLSNYIFISICHICKFYGKPKSVLKKREKKKKYESVSLKAFKKWLFTGKFEVEVDAVDNSLTSVRCILCSDHYKQE